MDILISIIGFAFIPIILFVLYFTCQETIENIDEYFQFKSKISNEISDFMSYLEKLHDEFKDKSFENDTLKSIKIKSYNTNSTV